MTRKPQKPRKPQSKWNIEVSWHWKISYGRYCKTMDEKSNDIWQNHWFQILQSNWRQILPNDDDKYCKMMKGPGGPQCPTQGRELEGRVVPSKSGIVNFQNDILQTLQLKSSSTGSASHKTVKILKRCWNHEMKWVKILKGQWIFWNDG